MLSDYQSISEEITFFTNFGETESFWENVHIIFPSVPDLNVGMEYTLYSQTWLQYNVLECEI